jgi:hypothetical protein
MDIWLAHRVIHVVGFPFAGERPRSFRETSMSILGMAAEHVEWYYIV